MLLPRRCAVCGELDTPLCEPCANQLAPPADSLVPVGLDRCVALFSYEGVGRDIIGRLKYANHRDALKPFATALAAAIDVPVDVVTWVPTTSVHRRTRGYDQAELIARAVARSLRCSVFPTVARTGASVRQSQIGLDRVDRIDRMSTAFVPKFGTSRRVNGRVVAVVDDVRTTGASLSAAGRALRSAGAVEVIGATFAATPFRGHI